MAIRDYQFVVGPETSTLPTATDPSGDADTVNLGFLNDRSYWGEAVATYAAMRALTSTQRIDNQVRQVDTGAPMELWKFDAANTSADDGVSVLKPDDISGGNPGRWLLLDVGGGGGGGGSGSGIDQLIQKQKLSKFGLTTEDLDNSFGETGQGQPPAKQFSATLLKQATAASSAVELVWNAKVVNDSDPNYDSATGWAVQFAATNIGTTSTAGEFTIGTAAIKFDKNNTNVLAEVFYDRGSANLSLLGHSRCWFYVYLPSVTNLSGVYVTIFKNGTDGARFKATLQADGSALAVGLNLIYLDLAGTPTAVLGAGISISELVRYVVVGVETTVNTQTYTGVAFDALYFSYRYPEQLGVIGCELTLFDTSNKENIVISSANTLHDGRLTTVSALTNTYVGGLTVTARGRVQRITMTNTSANMFLFDNDGTFSGAITTSQELRTAVKLRESLSGQWDTYIDVIPVQYYTVTTVGGSTIGVSDPVNQSANLVNTDEVHIFRPQYFDGKVKYRLIATRSLTAGSTHLSGVTTLTLTTTSIAVGDIVCKKHLTQAQISAATEAGNESFGTLTALSDPNSVLLVNSGLNYPYRETVWAHWKLGAIDSVDAAKNILGLSARNLAQIGSPNLTADGYLGRPFAFTSPGVGHYFQIPGASATELGASPSVHGTNSIQGSFWFYYNGTDANNRVFCGRGSFAVNGWNIFIPGTTSNMAIKLDGANISLAAIPSVGWHHCYFRIEHNTFHGIYIDGVLGATSSSAVSLDAAAYNFIVGQEHGLGTNFLNVARMVDLVIWRNAPAFSAGDVQSIYNAGLMRILGEDGPVLRYRYQNTGVSGQRLSLKARLSRTTTAVRPLIFDLGAIKTG